MAKSNFGGKMAPPFAKGGGKAPAKGAPKKASK